MTEQPRVTILVSRPTLRAAPPHAQLPAPARAWPEFRRLPGGSQRFHEFN